MRRVPIQFFKDFSTTTFMIFTDHCANTKLHFYKHVYTGLIYISNFTRNVQLTTTNTKTRVAINSYQMHTIHKQLSTKSNYSGRVIKMSTKFKYFHRLSGTDSRTFKDQW